MRSIMLFALPMILGDLLQQCYNVADTIIVGRFLGTDALAAAGLIYLFINKNKIFGSKYIETA